MKYIDNFSDSDNLSRCRLAVQDISRRLCKCRESPSQETEIPPSRGCKRYKNMDSHCLMNEVLAPVITHFNENLEPDAQKLANHCRWLIHNGMGLAGFGTTPEANSMSTEEKVGITMEDF